METAVLLFSDGSVRSDKTGYGAYLIVKDRELGLDEMKGEVNVIRFEDTSSTRLELQILLVGLEQLKDYVGKIIAYTDSQNIYTLRDRRKRLEEKNYQSKKKQPLKNSELYQKFFQFVDSLDCEVEKLEGHKRSDKKTKLDQYFSLVDRASRKRARAKDK
eukprot:TRINITY_DN21798_c0_g1_i1.p1 TRINITY_DN21798_c0_g1~~TRINITY_DN21798_c0_g1_i1.p1  ORF type:complete len:160 (+),score=31.49 TRINITY_DN21798_c0_g1_i1:133-612(+)